MAARRLSTSSAMRHRSTGWAVVVQADAPSFRDVRKGEPAAAARAPSASSATPGSASSRRLRPTVQRRRASARAHSCRHGTHCLLTILETCRENNCCMYIGPSGPMYQLMLFRSNCCDGFGGRMAMSFLFCKAACCRLRSTVLHSRASVRGRSCTSSARHASGREFGLRR